MRHTGLLTTDANLVVLSWDEVLERLTRVSSAEACGRPLSALAPDAEARGLLALLRESLATGSVTVLAPAIHHFLFECPPAEPSTEFDRMQQRVTVTPLSNDVATVGLAISIEDVTQRLEGERALGRALKDPDPIVRWSAVARFRPAGEDGFEALSEAMGDADWQVRRQAVGALAAHPDAELLQSIIDALRDGHHDFSLLSSALRLLSVTGMDAAQALIDLLGADDADLRVQAALALGMQKGPAVVEALLGALDDPDRNVQFHAVESLGKLHAPAAVASLGRIASSADFFLAFPAIEALVRIGDASAVRHIASRLSDPALGDAAAEALGALGDEDAVEPLVARLAERGVPVGPVVSALSAIHERYDETGGAGGRIEDLTRRMFSPAAASAVLDFVPVASGPELRCALLVLSWARTPSVAESLTRLLGHATVSHDVIETLVRFGSPVLDVLTAQLVRGDIDTRRAAAVALGRIGDRRAVPALIDVLSESEPMLLAPVAGALAHLGDERAFEPLIALLGQRDPAARQAVIGALNSIGHPAMAARIADLLSSSDPNVRQSAAKIAGYFGYPDAADALLACAVDPDEAVRAAALEHVAYLDHPGVLPVLMSAITHDTPRCRAAAATALGHLADPTARQQLIRALGDEDSWVRYFSARSLGRQRARDAVEALTALAADDAAAHVRIAAIDALGAIGGPGAVGALEPLAQSSNLDLAGASLRALGEMRVPAVMGILHDALRSADACRRSAAAQGLAAFGGRDAIEALKWTACADEDEGVVAAALAGLAALASRHGDTVDEAVEALAVVGADPSRRSQVLPVLTRIPPLAIPALAGALRNPDAAVRVVTVDALGRIARPPASSLLMQALDDPDAGVRVRAVEALARLGARGVGRRLATLARSDDSAEVRRVAELSLARVGGADAEGLS